MHRVHGLGHNGLESLSGRCYWSACLAGACIFCGRVHGFGDACGGSLEEEIHLSIHEGEGNTSTVNMCDVVESRIVNLKQWPRYRLGNPSVMFR